MLQCAQCGCRKEHARICYNELVFLHPDGSAGHIVRSSPSGVRNIDALFFMLVWARCSSPKKRAGTRYAKLVFFHPMVSAGRIVRSGASRA
jgi:hypothetical protein